MPQRGRHGVPDHLALGVEALQTKRRPDGRIALGMPDRATDPHPCGQTLALSRGRHGRVLRPFTRLTCTAPNDGAVNVAKTFGWDSTESGIPLPPRSPAATRWKASRRYQLAQERHRAARRLPQATSSTSSGSPSVE